MTVAGMDCAFCRRPIRLDDVVYTAGKSRRVWVHKECIVAAAEDDLPLNKYEQLRQRVLITGELFND